MSVRILARKISISKDSVHIILEEDLNCRTYKKRIEPLLIDAQKKQKEFNFQTEFKIIFEKKIHYGFYFRTKKYLILMNYVTPKMREYVQ